MVNKKSVVKRAAQVGIISTLTLSIALSANAGDKSYKIDVANIPLNEALIQFTLQSDWQFLSPQKLLKGKKATAVKGMMSRSKALQQLLEGTDLKYIIDDKGQVHIVPIGYRDTSSIDHNDKNIQVASVSYVSDDNTLASENRLAEESISAAAEIEEEAEEYIEEVVTTGSNIRGVESASPVFIYDREDIEKTGLSTLPQFIRTLPQVFGGGVSDGNIGISGAIIIGNIGKGTGINLRGLGTGSTLVLLDGHRMAAAGFGEFVDISIIPLTALERVEVLPDGASAIYGSDAVGGVVNFILRDNYDGAETRVRYGSVTEGSSDDVQIGQVFGKTWEGGHGLISYEYNKRTALDSKNRSFTKDSPGPTDLFPKQNRHSVFVKAGQNLTEKIELLGTAFYSSRKSKQFTASAFAPETNISTSRSEQYGATVGLQLAISDDWQGELFGSYNQNKTSNPSQTFAVPFSLGDTPIREFEDQRISSKVKILEAKTDGTLFHLSGGEVKVAIGGQYRREHFEWPVISVNSNRDIYAIYGEIFAPLISDENRRPGFEQLEATFATRYEHYSDFGSTTDPKFGLLWSPVRGFNLRGTYGTSFRAPLLQELSENNLSAFLLSVPDPDSPSQNIPGLLVFGNSSSLQPETATTWTAGFEIKPGSVPGLNIDLTYFNIKYKDRIQDPGGFFDGFTDPKFAPLRTKNPDQAFIDFWTSIPRFFNFTSFDPADTEIVFNRQLRNLASIKTSGLDFSLTYDLNTDFGAWNFTLNTTYLFKQLQQLLETADPVDVVDTVYNPAALRINGGISWNRDGFATNLRINHIGNYKDIRVDPAVGVNSWTTIDLNLSYNTEDRHNSPWLKNTIFSLSIQNLFDQDPPFVKGSFNANRNFDPDNATALGRFIAFQVIRKW